MMKTCRYLHRKRDRFHFRRRVPGLSTYTAPVTVALGTTDANLAHIWVGTLTREFERMFESFLLLQPPLPDALVARYFEHCLAQSVSDLHRQMRMARMMGRFRVADERRQALLPLIYQSFLKDGFRPNLPMNRVDPEWSSKTLELAVQLYVTEMRALRSPHADEHLKRTFQEISDATVSSTEHLAQLREAHIKARLMALSKVDAPPSITDAQSESAEIGRDDPPLPAELSKQIVTDKPALAQSSSPAPAARFCDTGTMASLETHFDAARKPALAATRDAWSTDIGHVFWRAVQANGMTDAVAKQRCTDIRRFMLITDVTSVREITQAHLTAWSDTLKRFPKTFLRSERDQHRTLDEILLSARTLPKSDLGLSAETMRRHVKSIELLLARAVAEGAILSSLDTKKVKPKKTSSRRKHKSRAVFRKEEAIALFRHSLWTGCKSAGRRHEPGSAIIKDGKFWIPLILAFTGARRAEIAGALASDVQNHGEIPVFVIQSNPYRGIKGEPADASEDQRLTRLVPIHSNLIDLGFTEYAAWIREQGHTLLFPDVVPRPRPGSTRSKAGDPAMLVEKFGECFDDAWRKAFQHALSGNPRNLCIHSLRHFVNQTLLHEAGVHDVTRTDLLGHIEGEEPGGTNVSTYREETDLRTKQAAIERLPRLLNVPPPIER